MTIPFMKLKWVSLSFSVVVLGATFYLTNEKFKGFKQGIDFAGGIKVEIRQNSAVTVENLRSFFKSADMAAVVQSAGKEADDLLKVELGAQTVQVLEDQAKNPKQKKALENAGITPNSVGILRYQLIDNVGKKNSDLVEFVSVNHVGPSIGEFLRESAVKLLLITLALITIYVAFRFRINFALGAMMALLHDLFVVLGIIGILQIPLSIPVVAALLTILGYSINDTMVVFDRIRENMGGQEKMAFEKTVDRSITESLTRTIITSVTTLIAITSVYVLGGEGLKDMAEVLILGIIVGTYSSTFIASPVVVISNRFMPATG